ncbi:hypothetical protein BU16DRAFT_527155 [Lophium mytilinum]|uniref:Uncharacterized protein n=1 Tax=Lophium mytilinum TaxID=390894 RepID=A0A6A6QSB8_9PEZI|nr:hypothetical protein BU16DRAFT_527155 [Lophium mytilinum]
MYSNPMEFLQQMGVGPPGGLPMPSSFPSAKEVRSKARPLSRNVLENWKTLNTIIERHEATIQKRWSKKTKESRKRILLSSWPDMNATHRPDLQAFKMNSVRRLREQERTRAAYLWPYINIEDLAKSKLLLLFINARGRNPPDAFARADIEACHFGMISGAIMPAFLNEYVMMFTGRHSPDTYGELLSWDDHPDAFEWFQTQRGCAHPGEGLMILEIQDRLYSFLVHTCKLILHEIPEASLLDSSTPVQPEPPSVSANETGLSSLAITAAEAPYRLPAALDLMRLESIVAAKLSAAEDHVLALREDPGYFARDLLEWKDHRQECLPDTLGRQHPLLSDPFKEPILWERVVQNALTTAISNLEMWHSAHEQIASLELLQQKHAPNISPDKDLPEEYAFALYRLLHHLKQFSKGPIGALKVGFSASPPMRPYFHRAPHDSNFPNKIRVGNTTGLPKDQDRDELRWIMMALFDDQQLHLAGLNTLTDELNRLTQSSLKARQLTSSWVDDQVSDLSVYSQCLHQIQIYQPWAATFEDKMAEVVDELRNDYVTGVEKFMTPYFHTSFQGALGALGNPSGGRFHYPVDKPRNRKNTEAMREAETELDAFWRVLQLDLERNHAITPRLRLLLSRPIQRTPAWTEAARKPTSGVEALLKPLSDINLHLEHSTEHTIGRDEIPTRKEKPKTRGAIKQAEIVPEAEPINHQAPEKSPLFKVDKRALRVLKTIFFEPSASAQPGEIAWGDFLHAMASTGFEFFKLGGSKWHFIPTKLDSERPIQIHEPHPTGKIPYYTALRHGRRLFRAYGWDRDMFALE